jgi:hypothetical protein
MYLFTSFSSSESNDENVIPAPPNLDGYAYPVRALPIRNHPSLWDNKGRLKPGVPTPIRGWRVVRVRTSDEDMS